MKVRNIGSNQTELTLKGATILFSYQIPVAAWVGGKFYRTEQHYSRTTSKHISQWLDGRDAETKPQAWFDNLTATA